MLGKRPQEETRPHHPPSWWPPRGHAPHLLPVSCEPTQARGGAGQRAFPVLSIRLQVEGLEVGEQCPPAAGPGRLACLTRDPRLSGTGGGGGLPAHLRQRRCGSGLCPHAPWRTRQARGLVRATVGVGLQSRTSQAPQPARRPPGCSAGRRPPKMVPMWSPGAHPRVFSGLGCGLGGEDSGAAGAGAFSADCGD